MTWPTCCYLLILAGALTIGALPSSWGAEGPASGSQTCSLDSQGSPGAQHGEVAPPLAEPMPAAESYPFHEVPEYHADLDYHLLRALEAVADEKLSAVAAVKLLRNKAYVAEYVQQQQSAPSNHADGPGSSTCRTREASGSKGILIAAGGRDQLANAYITLHLLYKVHGSNLPTEIVYYGRQEWDSVFGRAIQDLAKMVRPSIAVIDGEAILHQHHQQLNSHGKQQRWPLMPPRLSGFLSKVHALVWVCSFQHVLMLDSDNVPLRDPAPLFDSPEYLLDGNLFWSDFWLNQWMNPWCFSLLGLPVPWDMRSSFKGAESGQMLLDREVHADVLQWVWLLNLHSEVIWKCVYGDKDTFRMGFQLAGKGSQYHQLLRPPHQALSLSHGRLVHMGMMQPAPDGQLTFMHRTAAGKFWPHCVLHGRFECGLEALTMPVDQQQLLASVADPSMMSYSREQLDWEWQLQGCAEGALAGEQQHEGLQGDPSTAEGHLLACDIAASIGRLPIPVLSPERLPQGVDQALKEASKAFQWTIQWWNSGGHQGDGEEDVDGYDEYI